MRKRYIYESECGDCDQRAPIEIEVWDYMSGQVAVKNHAKLVKVEDVEEEKITVIVEGGRDMFIEATPGCATFRGKDLRYRRIQ